MLPLVFDAVISLGLDKFAEGDVIDRTRATVRALTVAQIRKSAELCRIYPSLTVGGISPVIVKGIVCASLYPKPDLRLSSDADFFIADEMLAETESTLTREGYALSAAGNNADKSVVKYTSPDKVLSIELHRCLFEDYPDNIAALNRYFDPLIGNCATLVIDNVPFRVMDDTSHMLYLIFHAYKHFLYLGFGLKLLCDLLLFARHCDSTADWKYIRCSVSDCGASVFFASLLRLGCGILGFTESDYPNAINEFPEAVPYDGLLDDILASGVFGLSSDDRVHSASTVMNALQTGSTSPSLLRTLFPSAKSLRARSPYLIKHPYLLPYAWMSRIFKALQSRTRHEMTYDLTASAEIAEERIALMRQYGIIEAKEDRRHG